MLSFIIVKSCDTNKFKIVVNGEATQDFSHADYPGNAWPWLLTFEKLLHPQENWLSTLLYNGNFENPDSTNLVGYDTQFAPNNVPPYMTDGSLRFTGIPYNANPHTNIIIPGSFSGTITVSHSDPITHLLPNERETGNVHWGPVWTDLDPQSQNWRTDMIIGQWIVVDCN